MRFYYAVFQIEDDNTLVSIPDVEICETFGKTWDEAYEMGIDALAACLSEPETIIHPKSSWKQLQALYPGAEIVPIPVDESIKKRYQPTRRINVNFPEGLLIRVDEFRSKEGMKRLQLLAQAAEEFLESRV